MEKERAQTQNKINGEKKETKEEKKIRGREPERGERKTVTEGKRQEQRR
jgi:hypothetical protein